MNAIMPPLVIDVRVREEGSRGFRIWFPFVILWPLLLIIVGFAFVVSLVVDFALLLADARYHHYTLLLFRSLQLLAAIRGTHARIDSDKALVDVNVY